MAHIIPDEVPRNQELTVDLLGPPHLSWNNQRFALPRRQPRALLYYLTVHLHPVSRAQLCYLLWPDEGERRARRRLSRLVNDLRHSLPIPDLLVVSEEQIALNAACLHSDTRTFMHLYGEDADRAPTSALQAAVALYRGDFLAGFDLPHHPEFDLWLAHERHIWQRRYLGALRRVIERHTAGQQYATAIEYLQRYLQTDPLAEQMHRRLITLYALTGQRSAALRQYEQCIVVLEQELGVDPTPATRTAYEEALHDRVAPPPAPILAPQHQTSSAQPIPLVDRTRVLSALYEAYGKAQQGEGSFMLLAGEPGSGKTRLLEEFVATLPAGTPVLRGRGDAGLSHTPYGVLVRALRDGLAAHGLPEVNAAWRAILSQLLPEVGAEATALRDVPLENETGQTRLLEALDRLVLGWSRPGSAVVLCLDDLHWADAATYAWLAYLKRRLAGETALVVGSYRSGPAHGGSGPGENPLYAQSLTRLRHALARSGVLAELELEGLDRASVRQLVASLLLDGSTADPAQRINVHEPLVARLQAWTGGNPFLLVELLQDLRARGRRLDAALTLEEIELPRSVQEAVRERLHDLDGLTRQVLDAAAVLGDTFPFAGVQQVCGRSELETVDALDSLVAHRLLVEEPEHYRFRHALVRLAVYRDLSHHRRRLLEGRAG